MMRSRHRYTAAFFIKHFYSIHIFRMKNLMMASVGRNMHFLSFSDKTSIRYTGLFEMIVGVLTTCHTQYTSDSSIYIFLFNRTTLQVFVTYLAGALYMHPLWFYKHQHDNRVHSKLLVACQWWWGYIKDQVYVIPLPASIPELKVWIRTAIETITADMLQTVWNELDYRVDVCRITKGAHIEHL